MRQLYGAVATPKLTYVADVWYTQLHEWAGRMNRCGLVGIMNRLASGQRLASLTLTGPLQSTAMDVLELHAGILPMQLLMHKVCHWEATRIHPSLAPTCCSQSFVHRLEDILKHTDPHYMN